jgi:hypothetical protein
MASALSKDHIWADLGKEAKYDRYECAVEDNLRDEDPESASVSEFKVYPVYEAYHRQVVYWTTRLPNTGPILNPARRPNT